MKTVSFNAGKSNARSRVEQPLDRSLVVLRDVLGYVADHVAVTVANEGGQLVIRIDGVEHVTPERAKTRFVVTVPQEAASQREPGNKTTTGDDLAPRTPKAVLDEAEVVAHDRVGVAP